MRVRGRAGRRGADRLGRATRGTSSGSRVRFDELMATALRDPARHYFVDLSASGTRSSTSSSATTAGYRARSRSASSATTRRRCAGCARAWRTSPAGRLP
ncbi:hypothetical protein LV779_34315 [Streptomyces thinghirensis]|nr:hypothetical protein [Streptomyces thinghirensis]